MEYGVNEKQVRDWRQKKRHTDVSMPRTANLQDLHGMKPHWPVLDKRLRNFWNNDEVNGQKNGKRYMPPENVAGLLVLRVGCIAL